MLRSRVLGDHDVIKSREPSDEVHALNRELRGIHHQHLALTEPDQLIDRFGNAAVKDTVARLCAESSDRIPKWLLPVVRENLESGVAPVTLSAAIVASWARYAEGVDEQGNPIKVVDRMADRLQETAQGNREDILAFLRDREVFGDLVDDERFTEPYARVLKSLYEVDAETTLDALLAELDSCACSYMRASAVKYGAMAY